MKAKCFFLFLLLTVCTSLNAQWTAKEQRGKIDMSSVRIEPISRSQFKSTHVQRPLKGNVSYRSLPGAVLTLEKDVKLQIRHRDDQGSIWTEGIIGQHSPARDLKRPDQRSLFIQHSMVRVGVDQTFEFRSADDYSILGVNIETGDIGDIYENTVLGYPSFSRLDDRMIFNAEGEDQTSIFNVIGVIELATDKINSQGAANIFYSEATWGEWFGNGARELVNILEGDREGELKLYPNPADQVLYLEADWLQNPEQNQIELHSIDGKTLKKIEHKGGSRTLSINIDDLSAGIYFLKLRGKTVHRIYKVIKS